jgi:hypothetical protein
MDNGMAGIVKRDGRREEYDRVKIARSLARAGVAPHMLDGIMEHLGPDPDPDTGSLRARIESVLALREPGAARRYASTCSLTALESEQAGYGWVCMNPDTVSRLSVRPGDMVWLSHDGATAPFSIESMAEVERGQARLNRREMAAMGVRTGTRLTASMVYQVTSHPPEEPSDHGRSGATSRGPERNGGR